MPFRNIYILGGHRLALSYIDTLKKARSDGNFSFEKIYSITNDRKANVFQSLSKDEIIFQSPAEFIIDKVFSKEKMNTNDVIVPDHTAKHVFLQVFLEIVKEKFPRLKTTLSPFESSFDPPYLHQGDGGAIWAMSYATWVCPSDCDEPGICPHIRDKRTWDFGKSFQKLFKNYPPEKFSIHLFACQPLLSYIACIPFPKIAGEIKQFVSRLEKGKTPTVIVATHSRCHSILGQFDVKLKRASR